MQDSSREQASRWMQTQGQEGPEGKEASSETKGTRGEVGGRTEERQRSSVSGVRQRHSGPDD